MGAMTNFLANNLRGHVFRNVSYTSPATVFLALFTTATTEAGGGTEVTGGSYARQTCAFSTTGNNGEVENTAAETFTNMPAATVTHMAVFDAVSGGNMLMQGVLPSPVVYTAGQSATWAIGELKLLID